MLRREIQARVLLARQRPFRRDPEPVSVIDTTTMWREELIRGAATYEPAEGWRYMVSDRHAVTIGYLIVEPLRSAALGEADFADRMTAWLGDLPDELTVEVVNDLAQTMPEGLDLTVANSRYLISSWEAEIAARARREQLNEDRLERERQRLAWELEIRSALRKRNLPAGSVTFGSGDSHVTVQRATLDQLLGIEAQ